MFNVSKKKLTGYKIEPQKKIHSTCSSLLAFVYRVLWSHQSNLNWKKDLNGSQNSYQGTYL